MASSQPKNAIKILYIITQGEEGGAQKYVYDLAVNLPLNFTPEVAMGNENTTLGKKLEQAGIKVFYLKNLVRNVHPLKELPAILEITQLIKREQPEIIHLNSTKAGVLGSIAARLAGNRRVIFTAHGLAFLEPKPWPVKQLYYWAERAATWFRKKIITVSDFDRKQAIITKLGPADKFITIHNGVDWNKFQPLSRQEARKYFGSRFAASGKLLIGTLANLYKTKGLPYLIDAAAEITKTNPNTAFVVIGFGSQKNRLERQIQAAGLQGKFHITGRIKQAENYLRAFDLFVLPSVKEGFPYSILLAAGAGLPIVSTDVGGIPEVLEDKKTALLIKPRNTVKLSEAMDKLISDKRLAESLGRNARERAKQFTLDKMVSQTAAIYQTVLKKH